MRKLFLSLAFLSINSFGATIAFQQGGWYVGGPLVVSFTGVDKDMDGALLAEELTEFRATWTEPEGTLTQWGLSDIEPNGFLFNDLTNFLLFVRNPEYSLVDSAFEGEFLATVFDSQLFPVDSTSSAASPVPEPATFGLFAALGIAAVLRMRLRRG